MVYYLRIKETKPIISSKTKAVKRKNISKTPVTNPKVGRENIKTLGSCSKRLEKIKATVYELTEDYQTNLEPFYYNEIRNKLQDFQLELNRIILTNATPTFKRRIENLKKATTKLLRQIEYCGPLEANENDNMQGTETGQEPTPTEVFEKCSNVTRNVGDVDFQLNSSISYREEPAITNKEIANDLIITSNTAERIAGQYVPEERNLTMKNIEPNVITTREQINVRFTIKKNNDIRPVTNNRKHEEIMCNDALDDYDSDCTVCELVISDTEEEANTTGSTQVQTLNQNNEPNEQMINNYKYGEIDINSKEKVGQNNFTQRKEKTGKIELQQSTENNNKNEPMDNAVGLEISVEMANFRNHQSKIDNMGDRAVLMPTLEHDSNEYVDKQVSPDETIIDNQSILVITGDSPESQSLLQPHERSMTENKEIICKPHNNSLTYTANLNAPNPLSINQTQDTNHLNKHYQNSKQAKELRKTTYNLHFGGINFSNKTSMTEQKIQKGLNSNMLLASSTRNLIGVTSTTPNTIGNPIHQNNATVNSNTTITKASKINHLQQFINSISSTNMKLPEMKTRVPRKNSQQNSQKATTKSQTSKNISSFLSESQVEELDMTKLTLCPATGNFIQSNHTGFNSVTPHNNDTYNTFLLQQAGIESKTHLSQFQSTQYFDGSSQAQNQNFQMPMPTKVFIQQKKESQKNSPIKSPSVSPIKLQNSTQNFKGVCQNAGSDVLISGRNVANMLNKNVLTNSQIKTFLTDSQIQELDQCSEAGSSETRVSDEKFWSQYRPFNLMMITHVSKPIYVIPDASNAESCNEWTEEDLKQLFKNSA